MFRRGDVELERISVEPSEFALVVGLNVYRVDVPYEVRQAGCDRLRIVPVPLANDGSFNLGRVNLAKVDAVVAPTISVPSGRLTF